MPIFNVEEEVHVTRRGFPDAQALLAGEPGSSVASVVDVGWFDTSVLPEGGSIALVREGGPLEGLRGDVIHVTRVGGRSVFAYVYGARAIPDDLALARRAFLSIAILTNDTVPCLVEVVA